MTLIWSYKDFVNDDKYKFAGRRWPIILGGGFGIGAAWASCAKDFNKLTASSRPKV